VEGVHEQTATLTPDREAGYHAIALETIVPPVTGACLPLCAAMIVRSDNGVQPQTFGSYSVGYVKVSCWQGG